MLQPRTGQMALQEHRYESCENLLQAVLLPVAVCTMHPGNRTLYNCVRASN